MLEQVVQSSCGMLWEEAMEEARLDGALGNLVWWEVSLPMAGGLELDGLLRLLPTQNIPQFYDKILLKLQED